MKASLPMQPSPEESAALPPLSERRTVHILNPVSGGSRYFEAARRAVEKIGGELRISERIGHIAELTEALFREDPFAHAVVYGGDGTVNEAVNGLMRSGAGGTGSFSVVPAGSGNDFSAFANDSGALQKSELSRVDVVKTETGGEVRYFANIMNIGFDCNTVAETETIRTKTFLRGSAAYLAGVAKTLIAKKTVDAKVTLEGCVPVREGEEVPETIVLEQKLLLTALANAQFYGGGFRAAPLASVQDGLMDVLLVNDISRLKFVSLVGDYRAGTYIDSSGALKPQFAKALSYRRVRKAAIEGAERFCLDGEILPCSDGRITVEVAPAALWYAAL